MGNRMGEWLKSVDGGSWVLMGGSSVEGRNKSAEWKIRKRNLSHHCWLPLSRCIRSMDSQGETCVSAQLLHLFKWDSQLHEVRPRLLSLCSSATAVHVWMKGGRSRVETEGNGRSGVWTDLREGNRINWFLKVTRVRLKAWERSIALMGRWDAHCDYERQVALTGRTNDSLFSLWGKVRRKVFHSLHMLYDSSDKGLLKT